MRAKSLATLLTAISFSFSISPAYSQTTPAPSPSEATVQATETAAPPAAAVSAGNDLVMKAMKDELDRSMKVLKLPNKPAPYFLSYRSSDELTYRFAYGNGSPLYDWKDQNRTVWVDVRVGDYDFDNTSDVGNTAASESIWRNTALDDNYSVIRRSLWDATDQAYKSASEDYETTLSYRQHHKIPNLCESFSKEKAVVMLNPMAPAVELPPEWKARLKELSTILNTTPGVRESWVAFQSVDTTRRYVNNEGSMIRDSWHVLRIGMVAFARCTDGEELWDSDSISVHEVGELPSFEELKSRAKALSTRLVAHCNSPIQDYYLGPVLLEPQPMAEFTIRNIAPLLCAVKGDNMRPQGTFLRSINSRVMPAFISIIDDPDKFKSDALPKCKIDSEGIPCQKVRLIDHGFLSDFLCGRSPVRPGQKSNGHDFSGTAPTNLVVESDKAIAPKMLREQLRNMAKDAGLKEYLVIRRIRPSTPLFMNGSSSQARDSSLEGEEPVDAVMVKTDTGEERRVRGLKFKELYKPSLQDIINTGTDSEQVTSTLWNGYLRKVVVPSALLSKTEMEADNSPTDAPYPVSRPTASD